MGESAQKRFLASRRPPSMNHLRAVKRERVLVVDDDPAILMLTRAKLEDAGFEVFICSDPLQASLMVAQVQPSLLVLDVVMPGLAGDRLAEALMRAGGSHSLSIVLHSALDGPALAAATRRAGALGAIRKSGDPHYFMFQLRRLLAQRAQPPDAPND